MPMLTPSTSRNLWLISQFELTRLFTSSRGWFALAAFIVVWYFLLRYPIFEASYQLEQPDVQRMLSQMLGMVGLYNLLNWSVPELSVYWLITLIFLPLVAIFFTADQSCSDRSRGTLRFLTLRTSRDTVFFGRFLGQMLIQSLFILLSLAATLAMAWWRTGGLPTGTFQSALIIALNLLCVVAPFTALMAACSAWVSSSRLAISLAIVGSGAIVGLLGWAAWYFPLVQPALEYLPGAQLPALMSQQGWSTFKHVWLPLLQTGVLLIIGRQIMQGKAL